MDEIIDSLAEQLGLSRSEVENRLGQFEVIPFLFKGEMTGAAILAGSEIHFVARPGFKGRCGTRRELFELFTNLFKKHDFLTTRIPRSTPPKDRTGERLGFTKSWSDDRFDYYIMTELPYAREK